LNAGPPSKIKFPKEAQRGWAGILGGVIFFIKRKEGRGEGGEVQEHEGEDIKSGSGSAGLIPG
jgi:hypothetical protein